MTNHDDGTQRPMTCGACRFAEEYGGTRLKCSNERSPLLLVQESTPACEVGEPKS